MPRSGKSDFTLLHSARPMNVLNPICTSAKTTIGFAVGPKHPWRLPIGLTFVFSRRPSEVLVETDRNENRYSAIASPNPVLSGAQNPVGAFWVHQRNGQCRFPLPAMRLAVMLEGSAPPLSQSGAKVPRPISCNQRHSSASAARNDKKASASSLERRHWVPNMLAPAAAPRFNGSRSGS